MIGMTNARQTNERYTYDLMANSTVKGLNNNTVLLMDYSLMGGGISTEINIGTREFVWENKANMNIIKKNHSGCGISTSSLSIGDGWNKSNFKITEYYDGNVWSNRADLNIGRAYSASCGNSNSALCSCGSDNSGGYYDTVEFYNGTTWSILNAKTIFTKRSDHGICGIYNNATICGGNSGSFSNRENSVEFYNGSSWSSATGMLEAKSSFSYCGSANDLLIAGGLYSSNNTTSNADYYNGINWSKVANISNINNDLSGCGIGNAALICGGHSAGGETYQNTELFDGTLWIAAADMNGTRITHIATGTKNDALIFGGDTRIIGTTLNTTEQYKELTTPSSIRLYYTNRASTDNININETASPNGDNIMVEHDSTNTPLKDYQYKDQLSSILVAHLQTNKEVEII